MNNTRLKLKCNAVDGDFGIFLIEPNGDAYISITNDLGKEDQQVGTIYLSRTQRFRLAELLMGDVE